MQQDDVRYIIFMSGSICVEFYLFLWKLKWKWMTIISFYRYFHYNIYFIRVMMKYIHNIWWELGVWLTQKHFVTKTFVTKLFVEYLLQWFIYLTIRVYIKWKLLDLQQKRTLVIMTEYDIPRGTVSLSCSWSWRVFCRSHLLYGMMAIGWHQWENTLVLNNKTTMRGPIRSKTYWFVFECKQNRRCLFYLHK